MLEEYCNSLSDEAQLKIALRLGKLALPVWNKFFYEEPDDIYRKIAGENIVKDTCGSELAKEILRQMREEGKSFWDEWEEYYSGTCKTYSYNKEKNSFWRSEADVVAASFFEEYPMTEQQMLDFISGVSLSDLRGDGFEI